MPLAPYPEFYPDSRSPCSECQGLRGQGLCLHLLYVLCIWLSGCQRTPLRKCLGNAHRGHTEGKRQGPKSRFLPTTLCWRGLGFRPMLCEVSRSRRHPAVIRLFSELASQACNVCGRMGPCAQMYHNWCITPFLLNIVRGDRAESRDSPV